MLLTKHDVWVERLVGLESVRKVLGRVDSHFVTHKQETSSSAYRLASNNIELLRCFPITDYSASGLVLTKPSIIFTSCVIRFTLRYQRPFFLQCDGVQDG